MALLSPPTTRCLRLTPLPNTNGLGGNFRSIWPLARDDDPATEEDESSQGVSSVEALDDLTVKISFNFEPGLAIWPLSVGVASIFQEAFWGPIVDASPDAETLYAASGLGAPNGSAFASAEWEPGAFWRNVATGAYWDTGSQYKVFGSGAVEYTSDGATETWGGTPGGDVLTDYTEGPFISETIYSIYSDQNTAVLALTEGEVDFLLNPLGLQAGPAERGSGRAQPRGGGQRAERVPVPGLQHP